MLIKTLSVMFAAGIGASLMAFADPPAHARGDALPPGLAKQGKVPPGHAKKLWKRGEYLPIDYRDRRFNDWDRYDLRRAPAGYDWVRVDNDVYLTQIATGLVADVVLDLLD